MDKLSGNGFWVGIDVAKDSFVAAIAADGARPDQWAQLPVREFKSGVSDVAALALWIGEHPGSCRGICAEATGVYSKRLAALIEAAGLPAMVIVNPLQPLGMARSLGLRDKTDRVDAAVIALYGLIHRPLTPRRDSPIHDRLRGLWRLREVYVAEKIAFGNRIAQADDSFVIKRLRASYDQMERSIAKTEEEMKSAIAAEPALRADAKLLQTIPGIGWVTASMLLAELGDLRQYGRRQIVGYAGLFPRAYSSGTSVHRPARLAKGGAARVRKGMFYPACALRRRKNPLAQFADRLAEKGKAKMSAIGAMMRKLLTIARAVVISGRPFDPSLVGPPNLA
jgi:transposase